MKRMIVVWAVVVSLATGCSFFGSSAKISEMIPGMSPQMDRLECWLTLVFETAPKDGAMNVAVRFTSTALEEGTETFDWAYIADHDVVSEGFMKGFSENTASSPDAPPPLKIPVKVKFPLKAKARIDLAPGEIIVLRAELLWGGKVVDSSESTIEHVYRRE